MNKEDRLFKIWVVCVIFGIIFGTIYRLDKADKKIEDLQKQIEILKGEQIWN